jgi:isoleucyl-tRNA synthetase
VVSAYKGQFVKDADEDIIKDLKKRGLLFRKEMVLHSYPHCWRCDSPLLYYARKSWYIRTTQFKDKMLKNNSQINWYPPEVGEGRFGEWLNNNVDWALSRDRYWGTPLNIWRCPACEHQTSIGSIRELREKGKDVPSDIDLHKPYVDRIKIPCPECGAEMERTPEVIDVWFDSGSMPYAQWHYPFENKELFEKNFPADFICEGVDQTRGWFYSLLAISTMLFDKPAFYNIIVNELVLDKEGQKMSKTRGNAVIPEEIISRFGVDALRWYFITVSAPWVPKRFDIVGIGESYRKFLDTLFNTYNFFALYANIDGFSPDSEPVKFEDRSEIDRWILSLLYSIVEQVTERMENFDMTRAARLISDFILDDVSNWYVRRNRRRFWKGEMSADKHSAYPTQYEVLLTTAHLIAPFIPFVADELYLNLKTGEMPESVHLADFPAVTPPMKKQRDAGLERRMRAAQEVVSLTRALRNNVRIKVRQPLQNMVVATQSKSLREAVLETERIIKDEVNVKEIQVTENISDLVTRKARPVYKTLGPRVGKMMKKVAEIIENFNEDTINRLEMMGEITLDLDRAQIHVHKEDVEILEEKKDEDFAILRDDQVVVGLNTIITPGLENEGIAREFVNRVQNLRKDSGFDVTDRITINYQAPQRIANAIAKEADYIKTETLAVKLKEDSLKGNLVQEISLAGDKMQLVLKRIEEN